MLNVKQFYFINFIWVYLIIFFFIIIYTIFLYIFELSNCLILHIIHIESIHRDQYAETFRISDGYRNFQLWQRYASSRFQPWLLQETSLWACGGRVWKADGQSTEDSGSRKPYSLRVPVSDFTFTGEGKPCKIPE